jgi:hypothetical protein
MENQVNYAERMVGAKPFGISQASKRTIETVSEAEIFAKLEAAKNEERGVFNYKGFTFSQRIDMEKKDEHHQTWFDKHTQRYGYAPHISRLMLGSYCSENNLKINMIGDYVTNEYASMMAHKMLEEKGLKESTLEIAEEATKQALCFKALKESDGTKELTTENTKELHSKANLLSQYLTKENIHVLDDKNFMKLAYKNIARREDCCNMLSKSNTQHLVKLNHEELSQENEKSLSHERSIGKNKDRDFELSI